MAFGRSFERSDPKEAPWHLGGLRRRHFAKYEFAAQWAPGQKVVDVACGVGYGSVMLADAGAAEIVSMDISEDAIGYAKANYPHPTVRYEVRDASDTRLPDQWADVIVSLETIEHLPTEKVGSYIQELRRVLKAEGTLIMSTPNGSVSYNPSPYHVQEFSLPELQALLGQQFGDLAIFGQRMIPEWCSNQLLKLRKLGRLSRRVEAVVWRLFFDGSSIRPQPQPGKQPFYYIIVASEPGLGAGEGTLSAADIRLRSADIRTVS